MVGRCNGRADASNDFVGATFDEHVGHVADEHQRRFSRAELGMLRPAPYERFRPLRVQTWRGSELAVEYTPLASHNGDAVMDPGRIWIRPRFCPSVLRRVADVASGRHWQAAAYRIPSPI